MFFENQSVSQAIGWMKTSLIPRSYAYSFQETQVQDQDNEEEGDEWWVDVAVRQQNGNLLFLIFLGVESQWNKLSQEKHEVIVT